MLKAVLNVLKIKAPQRRQVTLLFYFIADFKYILQDIQDIVLVFYPYGSTAWPEKLRIWTLFTQWSSPNFGSNI